MIEYKNISIKIDNRTLFHNFNLIIQQKEKVLLNAPSGTGKTTLVKMLLGFIRYKGEIFYNDVKLSHHTRNEFRKNISYVSQDVDLPNIIVETLIKEILCYKINKHIQYNERTIIDYMHKFNLKEDTLEKNINDLSGGERARVGLIIALLLDRPLFILDEITAGLDEKLKKKLIEYILDLNKTIIIISHDPYWMQQENITVVRWGHE